MLLEHPYKADEKSIETEGEQDASTPSSHFLNHFSCQGREELEPISSFQWVRGGAH